MTPTADNPSVLAQIAAIGKLDRAQMREEWTRLFGTSPPGYGPDLMRRRLIYRVQELAYGGLAEATRQRLREIDQQAQERAQAKADPHRPVAGTLLIKEYGGERHEVVVLAKGYQYRGQCFDSLSRIATHITGTTWNGWRFFGLRREKKGAA